MTPVQSHLAAAAEAALTAAFRRRRCWCGARAISVAPGTPAVWHGYVLVARGEPERCYCLAHLGKPCRRFVSGQGNPGQPP